ncbi:MAG: response regulator transcription factor [Acidimicrobiia bacterium]
MTDEPTVLFADDDDMMRALVESRLLAKGYRVLIADTGLAALSIAAEARPTVIVLDWMMPGLGGPEVCRRLKESHDTAHIPILLLTARAKEDDIRTGFDHGADDYLTKPFEVSELLEALDRLIPRG